MAIRFVSSNIISSLGFTTYENMRKLLAGQVGIISINNPEIYSTPFMASMVESNKLEEQFNLIGGQQESTRLEQMILVSVSEALSKTDIDITSPRTMIVLSTTKGNIDLLQATGSMSPERALLWKMAEFIGLHFGNPNPVRVVSNACISGVLAINTAVMMLNSSLCDHAVVVGADLVSRFVVSGFMSFLSLSSEPCKPFDRDRDGLSLGEAAGTLILEKTSTPAVGDILFLGGATANDANHISGPSRTGEGSVIAIENALLEADKLPSDIDHINAHGTATRYNDDMESIALQRTGLLSVPANSYKGSWGHTLGAAGIIETAALVESMKQNVVLPTAGFNAAGTTHQLTVSNKPVYKSLDTCLKLGSGFGGCNAALILQKMT